MRKTSILTIILIVGKLSIAYPARMEKLRRMEQEKNKEKCPERGGTPEKRLTNRRGYGYNNMTG